MAELRTERLLLRSWQASDREPFAALNADPQLMRHFPAPLSRAESDALADRIAAQHAEAGWGLWAVEELSSGRFVGFVGLAWTDFEAHFTPAVEIGWRLARHVWGNGFATEAARVSAAHGFDMLGLEEIISFTTVGNERSRAVMRRLGMRHDPADDFDHPRIPAGHPLRRHVLYRLAGRSEPATLER